MAVKDIYINLKQELEKSSEIQRAVLPDINNLSYLKASVIYRPYLDVSGDLYDCLINRENEYAFFLGDVTGHGFSAALMTMMVHILIENIQRNLSTNEYINQLNELIVNQKTGLSVSGVFFRITADGSLTVSHAGHPPLLVVRSRDNNVIKFEEGGCPLGIFKEAPIEYVEENTRLNKGDIVVAYSDGLIECRNKDHEMFSLSRLIKFLQHNHINNTNDIKAILELELDNFLQDKHPDDDLTVLLIRYTGED